MNNQLSQPERWKFLHQCYFGAHDNEIDGFVSRAYRDMNRTLRGMSSLDPNGKICADAKLLIKKNIDSLAQQPFPEDRITAMNEFDSWHATLCRALVNQYETCLGSGSMTYGQAQKWVNMTFKYCWVCGGQIFDQLGDWFRVAHIAVDEFILIAVKEANVVPQRPCRKWSTWNNRKEYEVFQMAVREFASSNLPAKTPLELEFEWWLKHRPSQAVST